MNTKTNAILRLNQILKESLELRHNKSEIDELVKLFSEAETLCIQNNLSFLLKNLRLTKKDNLEKLISHKDKPKRMIYWWEQTLSSMKKDITDPRNNL